MRRLVAGEFAKLFTTRLWLWLLLGSIALTALFASLAIVFGDDPDNPTPPLWTAAGQRTLFSVGQGGAAAFVAVLAAIGFAGEFRHKTATQTFLAAPLRAPVVLAKVITYGLVGFGYALVCNAVTVAIALPWLSSKQIDVTVTQNGIPATLLGVTIVVTLFGVLGAGLGALLRDQTATVVALLIYLFVVEPVITRIPALADWARFLPGAAADALAQVSQANQEFLQPWQGGVVLAGYAAVIALAGGLITTRRDVT